MPLNIIMPQNPFSEASVHTDACIYIAPPFRLKHRHGQHYRVGHAVLLKTTDEHAPRIIAAAAPLYFGGLFGEKRRLRACCVRALKIAKRENFKSVTISPFTGGRFAFPAEKMRTLLISFISKWLAKNDSDMAVTLLSDCRILNRKTAIRLKDYIFDKRSNTIFLSYSSKSSPSLPFTPFDLTEIRPQPVRSPDDNEASEDLYEEDDWYEEDWDSNDFDASSFNSDADGDCCAAPSFAPEPPPVRKKRRLEDVLGEVGESFSQMLFRLIDQRGMTDPEVYKRANMDRRLFSKIRSNPDYQPAKGTVLSLAIALQLNLDQTTDLLRRAGFALSPSSKSDLIVEFFIREQNFNIHDINEALFAFKQKLLGV